MKAIYKLNADFGRQGILSGVFVADTEEVEKLLGTEIYFGEVLGKHSVVLVTKDKEVVALFEEYDLESGINPFHYLEEEEEE